jgi:hypothetical protein
MWASNIPHEPGLYWASVGLENEFDAIVHVYGESPFLKIEIINLHVSRLGKRVDVHRSANPIIGPRVTIPEMPACTG